MTSTPTQGLDAGALEKANEAFWGVGGMQTSAPIADAIRAYLAALPASSGGDEDRVLTDASIEALTPSAQTKAAYIGEFFEEIEVRNPEFDPDDDDCKEPETVMQRVPISWTTVKQIMAAIRANASALSKRTEGERPKARKLHLLPNDAEALRLSRDVMERTYRDPEQQKAAIQCAIIEGMRLAIEACNSTLANPTEQSSSPADVLLEKLRCTLNEIVAHVADEGDRAYFGSTNDVDQLREIQREIDAHGWAKFMSRPDTGGGER